MSLFDKVLTFFVSFLLTFFALMTYEAFKPSEIEIAANNLMIGKTNIFDIHFLQIYEEEYRPVHFRKVNEAEVEAIRILEEELISRGHPGCLGKDGFPYNIFLGEAETVSGEISKDKFLAVYQPKINGIIFLDKGPESKKPYVRLRVFVHEAIHHYQVCSNVPRNADGHHDDYFSPVLWEEKDGSVLVTVSEKLLLTQSDYFLNQIGFFD